MREPQRHRLTLVFLIGKADGKRFPGEHAPAPIRAHIRGRCAAFQALRLPGEQVERERVEGDEARAVRAKPQRRRDRVQRVSDRNACTQEPLERGDEQAAVPRRGGTRAHAVRQEQARRSGVGEKVARVVARDRRALLLLTANADDRTVRRPLVHLNVEDALAALFLLRCGQRHAQQRRQTG